MSSFGTIGPIIARGIAERLAAQPTAREQLVKAGLPGKKLDHLTTPEGHENTLFTQAKLLEKVLGIDLCPLLLAEAKHRLWSDNDQLADITSHKELVAALDKYEATHSQRRLAYAIEILPGDFNRFRAWKAGKRQITIRRFKLVLQAILADRTNQVPSAVLPSHYQQLKKVSRAKPTKSVSPDSNHRTDGSPHKLVGYALSTIGTQVTVLETILSPSSDPAMVNEGDRLQALRSIGRLLAILGISKDKLHSLQHPKLLNTDEGSDLVDVLTSLLSSEKRK